MILRLARDERAAVLVEFAIVMPVILLFFLGTIQYLQVVRASQHGNYAAFCAARVYAVRASVDGPEKATKLATQAAAMALAPIAELKPGEIPLFKGTPTGLIPDQLPKVLQRSARLAIGYAVAWKLRLNPKIGGGSVTITEEGSPKQVFVEISYPQPIYIPGLSGLWNFVHGDKIYTSMKPLREGLTGIPGNVLPYYEDWESAQRILEEWFGIRLPDIPPSFRLLPYVNVRSKCAIGFEDWGRRDPEYRPRIRDTVRYKRDAAAQAEFDQAAKDAADAKSESDRAKEDAEGQQKEANQLQNAQDAERAACSSYKTEQARLEAAKRKQDVIRSDPNATQAQKDAAANELRNAIQAEANARLAYNEKHNSRINQQRAFEQKYRLPAGSYRFECN
jgi:hypothetical protein